MKAFAYARVETIEAALALAARPGARFLGGGTNLVDLMKLGVERPDLLVDVTGIGLNGVAERDGAVHIGATVRNADLAIHPGVRARLPVLSQALLAGASPQLRNVATVGGNLLQRTRCLYFQDVTKACNKRVPGSGCPARTGHHRNLAILGGSQACIATHPSDLAVALAALGAHIEVVGPDGIEHAVPIEEFFRLPGDDPTRDTTLEPGTLLTAVHVPLLADGTRSAYAKARDRASFAFAIGSVAAALRVVDGVVADVRLAFGAVAPVPWRAYRAEDALRGMPATEESFRAAAAAELAAAEGLPGNSYKVSLLGKLTVRVLAELT